MAGLAAAPSIGKEQRIAIAALATGQFSIALGGMIGVGIQPLISHDLGVGAGAVGQTGLGFGMATALCGPLLVGPTSRMDRRTLLCIGLVITSIATLLAALSTGVGQLMLSRVLAGIGAGVYAPTAIATAGRLVPTSARGRAVANVFVGLIVASAIGLPAGTLVAEVVGWRGAYLLTAASALCGLVSIRMLVPGGIEGQPTDGKAWRGVLRSPVLLAIVAVSLLQVMGKSVLATYFAPTLIMSVQASGAMIALLLMANGVSGVVGNMISARIVDRVGAVRLVNLTLAAVLVPHVLFPLSQLGVGASLALMILLGLLGSATAGTQQARIIAAAPALAPATLALNVSANWLGSGLGSAIGALSLDHLPISALGPVAASIVALALAVSLSVEVAARSARNPSAASSLVALPEPTTQANRAG